MNKGCQKTTISETRPIAGSYSLSYSPSQAAFHVETVAELLTRNMSFLVEHRQYPDYLLIGVYPTYEEADRWCAHYQKALPEVVDPVETTLLEIEKIFRGDDGSQ